MTLAQSLMIFKIVIKEDSSCNFMKSNDITAAVSMASRVEIYDNLAQYN